LLWVPLGFPSKGCARKTKLRLVDWQCFTEMFRYSQAIIRRSIYLLK
jgi:hypothetical protein